MPPQSERLTILSEAEYFALYGLPDFDDRQRLDYLSLDEAELALASHRPSLGAKVHCILQMGYFKAKHAFFRFSWDEVPEDRVFVLTRYFNAQPFEPQAVTKHERYTQRALIAAQFGYRPWSAEFLPPLAQQTTRIVRRDVTPGFIVAELLAFLNEQKIVRPGYRGLGINGTENRFKAECVSGKVGKSAPEPGWNPLGQALVASLEQTFARIFVAREVAR